MAYTWTVQRQVETETGVLAEDVVIAVHHHYHSLLVLLRCAPLPTVLASTPVSSQLTQIWSTVVL